MGYFSVRGLESKDTRHYLSIPQPDWVFRAAMARQAVGET